MSLFNPEPQENMNPFIIQGSLVPDIDTRFNLNEFAKQFSTTTASSESNNENEASPMSPDLNTSSATSMPLESSIFSAVYSSQLKFKTTKKQRTSTNISQYSLASYQALSDSKKRENASSSESEPSGEEPFMKKLKSTGSMSIGLHAICMEQNLSSEERLKCAKAMIQEDPLSVCRPVSIQKFQRRPSFSDKQQAKETVETATNKRITYPLNLAITGCSKYAQEDLAYAKELLGLLIQADPSVVGYQEVPTKENSLHLLLKHMPGAVDLVDDCIRGCAQAIMMVDNMGNTPLHVAVQHATAEKGCLDAIMHLAFVYPQAMRVKTLDGKTPLDLAQERTDCPESIVSYLQEKSLQTSN